MLGNRFEECITTGHRDVNSRQLIMWVILCLVSKITAVIQLYSQPTQYRMERPGSRCA